jgi:hypothetical protein
MRRLAAVAVAIILSLSFAGAVRAQSTSASITGRVTDPQKALIVGATVAAINSGTNVRYEGTTNKTGDYYVTNLPPGTYRIEVERPGFKTVIKPDVVLHIQDAIEINFEMTLGSVSETVTVEASGMNINTTDGSVSTVVDQSYIQNMPLNGRSFQDLILLTPGTLTQTPQLTNLGTSNAVGVTGEFSVNGQRTESNYYTVDGVSANVGAAPGSGMTAGAGGSGSIAGSTALGTTQALVSVDDLQEFRVQSSTYSAEYGRNPGGQFAFQTKSGTNQWHGTAYDYLRNGYFDAQDWFNDYFGTPEPALRQNDFGGTLGGPVRIPHVYNGKDKTFFFVSYEGLRLTAPQAATPFYVPDAALRTSTPAPLNQVLNAFPVQSPNGIDDTANGIAQYIGSWSNPSSINSTSVRFDHSVNDKLRLFFRFSGTTSSSGTRGPNGFAPTIDQTSAYTMRTYTAGATSILTNHLSNDFRLNYSSNEVTSNQVIDALGGSTPVNLVQLAGLGPGSSPAIALLLGGQFLEIASVNQSGAQRQWNFVDTLSRSFGHHQLKFGVDYRRLVPFSVPYNPVATWFYSGESAVQANSGLVIGQAFAPAYPLYTNFSAFAQDEWKISQRLSLSLGLRWEVNPAPDVTQGLQPYTIQGSGPSTWTLATQGTPLWHTTYGNFAPRLGAAYILHDAPGRETVVRGGGGVFFDTGQQLGSISFGGPGFAAQSNVLGPFPGGAVIPPIVNPPVGPYNNLYGFAPHLQLPYTLQWNASIEQALGRSQTFTVSYVGSHGSRLLQENEFEPTNNPNATFVSVGENGLTSDYDSLQVQFRRRLAQGLTALASYTWSHCIDYGSSNYLLGYQRGNCDFDVRHNFSAALSYDLPNVGHDGFANAVLRHWGLDDRVTARTAFPVDVIGNTLFQPNGQVYNGGLDSVPGQPVYLYGANCASVLQGLGNLQSGQGCPGGRAINPNAFVGVSSGYGDVPRNFARGFDAVQMDLAVRREFPIYENLKLQFRAEAFNIFNHPNFGAINSTCGGTSGVPGCTTPQFGLATATLASSLGVLSPLYQQGGPRSMQFALKLIF